MMSDNISLSEPIELEGLNAESDTFRVGDLIAWAAGEFKGQRVGDLDLERQQILEEAWAELNLDAPGDGDDLGQCAAMLLSAMRS